MTLRQLLLEAMRCLGPEIQNSALCTHSNMFKEAYPWFT